jgi:Ca-activated chloride channel family protein
MHRLLILLAAIGLLATGEGLYDEVTQGALRVRSGDGRIIECPLRHTAYSASIAGLVAQVEVVQTFVNPFPEAVEAVYVFPLSHEAGVNGMTLEIGERRLVGALLKRADARAVYEQAKAAGKTTSLLDQERPNVFTQTVGNLPPGGEVRIRIAYAEQLAYDRGTYEFHLPLVVGPRYMPGNTLPGAPSGTGVHPDTDRVPDAARISPPVLLPGQRTGHDVSIHVSLDAGLAIHDLVSANHQVAVERPSPATAAITLASSDSIPNKDFVLRYAVAGAKPEVSAVSHVGTDGGWLLLTLQPAQIEAQLAGRRPRDLCFLVDVSGSMSGAPIAKVREAMRALLALAGPEDRVQVITFAGSTQTLFPAYLPPRRLSPRRWHSPRRNRAGVAPRCCRACVWLSTRRSTAGGCAWSSC